MKEKNQRELLTIKKPARLFGGLQSDCTHSFMSTNAVLMVWCISLSSLWRFLKIGKYAWLLRRISRYDRQKRKAMYSLKSCGLLVQCRGFFSYMFDWVVCMAFNFVENGNQVAFGLYTRIHLPSGIFLPLPLSYQLKANQQLWAPQDLVHCARQPVLSLNHRSSAPFLANIKIFVSMDRIVYNMISMTS